MILFPNYVANHYHLAGNLDAASFVQQEAQTAYLNKVSLYDAQELITKNICSKFGSDWYQQSAEAVQFIIEATYASLLRKDSSPPPPQ